ncbi:MAG: hypothetical protein K1060chlam5_00189 [Candidatus Anoxychlamydiales bacterium]|nr:hypothetical protein [Candidatus Anoxychlamydiales bacterium]
MYSFQLELIRKLQLIRFPLLVDFFKSLNFFDSPNFIFILIPAVWVGYYYKSGVKLFYALVLSNFFNVILKQLFMLPRPFHLDPVLAVIKVKGYGFPSGGAQSAILLALIMITKWNNKTLGWVLGVNFFFWISLSRVYLGVHFITDVLGGWVVGLVVFLIYYFLFPKIEMFFEKKSLKEVFIITQVFFLMMIGLYLQIINLAITSLAIGLGVFLLNKYKLSIKPSKIYINIVRAILGIAGVFLIHFITSYLLSFFSGFIYNIGVLIQSYILGLWISIGAFYIYNLIVKRSLKR